MSAIAGTEDQEAVESYSAAAAEAFAGRMLQLLNDAALGLILCIGYRSGLLDALARFRGGAACETIAEEASLSAPAVRECLAALVHGRILAFDAIDRTYRLPAEHAAFLAGPQRAVLALAAESLSLISGERLLDFLRFGNTALTRGSCDRLQQAFDVSWRGDIVEALSRLGELEGKLRAGISVLIPDCDDGAAVVRVAGEFPNSRFVGSDPSEPNVETARARARELGLSNAAFTTGNFVWLAADRAYDLVLLQRKLLEQDDLAHVLAHVHRALKRDGVLVLRGLAGSSRLENDLDRSAGSLLAAMALLRQICTSSAQPGSAWMGREPLIQLLHEIGFRHVRMNELPHDSFNAYFVCEKE